MFYLEAKQKCKQLIANFTKETSQGGLFPTRWTRYGFLEMRRRLLSQKSRASDNFLTDVEKHLADAPRIQVIVMAEMVVDSCLPEMMTDAIWLGPRIETEHTSDISGETLMAKFRCITNAFDKRATSHPRLGRNPAYLLGNDETDRLAKARIIWNLDNRPIKKDGHPDLRFKKHPTTHVKFIHKKPKPEPEPEPKPEPAAPKPKPQPTPEEIAALAAEREERRLAKLRARAENAKMARQRVLKEHKAKVVKENGCHRRLRNFWKTGFRTCEICTEIKATDDSLSEYARKALGNTKHHGRTKMRGYTWNPTAQLWIPKDEDSNKKPVERQMIEHHKGRRRRKSTPEDQYFITADDVRQYGEDSALKYLVGTDAHERRLARIMGAAPSVSESLRESADTIEAESKKLEETTHMVASRPRKLVTNRATPKQTN